MPPFSFVILPSFPYPCTTHAMFHGFFFLSSSVFGFPQLILVENQRLLWRNYEFFTAFPDPPFTDPIDVGHVELLVPLSAHGLDPRVSFFLPVSLSYFPFAVSFPQLLFSPMVGDYSRIPVSSLNGSSGATLPPLPICSPPRAPPLCFLHPTC